MANVKISALPAGTAIQPADIVAGVQSGTTVSFTGTQLKTVAVGAGSVSISSGKTLTVTNTVTLSGTDGTTMTFPSSSTTVAGLSIANVFTALQTAQGASTTQPGWYVQLAGDSNARVRLGLNSTDIASIGFGSGSAVRDLFLERAGAAKLRIGAPDAAAPVAQTLSVQNGTGLNAAGANFTIDGSQSTGTGTPGFINIATSGYGSSSSTPNALATLAAFGPSTLAGSASDSALSIAQTWNTTGVPSLIKANATATAVGSFSRLLELQVGGTPWFAFGQNSNFTEQRIWMAGGSSANGSGIVSDNGILDLFTSTPIGSDYGSNARMRLSSGGAVIASTGSYGFSSTTTATGTPDTILTRDAANILAQRNGTNAQNFRLYNTFTDASNYERAFLAFSTNIFQIGTAAAGTGTARNMQIVTAGSARWTIDTSGNFLAATDNSWDIGASGATRPRNIYVGTNLIVPGGTTAVLKSAATITSGAGSGLGTLTNAPTAGDPTSWIPISDNGTTRYIPAW